MRKLFVSYARENKADVDQLVAHLGTMGYDTWVDAALRGGQDWWDEILQRIADTDVVIAIYSAAALNSTACAREFEWAVALGKPVVPVAVEPPPTALPSRFARRQIIDYSEPAERPLAALKLQGALATLPPAPPPPDPLPEPPAAPLSYLTDLIDLITQANTLDHDQQHQILLQLEPALSSFDPLERRGGRDILERFSARRDLYADVDRAITRLKQLPSQPAPVDIEPSTQTTTSTAEQSKVSVDAGEPAGATVRAESTSPTMPAGPIDPNLAANQQRPAGQPPAGMDPQPGLQQAAAQPWAPSGASGAATRAAPQPMSIGEFACVLTGVVMLSIAMVYCVVPWRGARTGALATCFIIGAISGIALLIRGRGRRFSGQTIAGCALVTIGLSTLLLHSIGRMHLPMQVFIPLYVLIIVCATGLLLTLVPMRQPPPTVAIARGYLLSGGAILIMAFLNTVVITPQGFFGAELARFGPNQCNTHIYASLAEHVSDPELYLDCDSFGDAQLRFQEIGALTGLVLVAAGVIALRFTRRAANRASSHSHL